MEKSKAMDSVNAVDSLAGKDRLKTWLKAYQIVLIFAVAKLVIHLLTATNYGFQRDAYLYLAQSQHLDWGFFSTPPLLAFVTRIHTFIWGDSLLAVRLLPALIGSISLFIVGWLIKQLKGGNMALLIGLTAYLVSPAFLRPAALLQPVLFNHFFWLLAAVVVFQLVRKQDPKILLWMIPVLGLGWLAKYSIIFYGSALLAALVISRHRKLLWSWYLPVALVGGLLVILPNLIWQVQHNWPVISHMGELQDSQLGNVMIKDFLLAQLFMHFPALMVWLGGLIWLIFNKEHRKHRVFAWAFVITLLMIMLLEGKFYYTIAAYTILVVFGAVAWEQWALKTRKFVAYIVLGLILWNGMVILPFSLPVLKPDRMVKYDRVMIKMGLGVMLKWEDGEVHDLPQDYADMVGWDELGQMVWTYYDALPPSVQEETMVYGEFYGAAGAVRHHRPDASYPDVHSFNDAFMEWIPRNPQFEHLLYVGYSDRIPLYFDKLELVGRVDHPHFRERGLPVWFGSHPTPQLWADWEESWQESKGRFTKESEE